MWNDREEEKKEATWDEQSDFRKDFYRSLTFSEFDRAHKTVVFCHEQDIPARELNGCSVTDKADQINFISQYYILTHQGTYIQILQMKPYIIIITSKIFLKKS